MNGWSSPFSQRRLGWPLAGAGIGTGRSFRVLVLVALAACAGSGDKDPDASEDSGSGASDGGADGAGDGGDGAGDGGDGAGDGGDGAGDGGDGSGDGGDDDLGNIADVATELCDSAPGTGSGSEAERVDGQMQQISLADFPDARCNDGTPASIYVRAATNPDHATKWVVYFKGGSQCLYWDDCVDRWCEETSLMTSLGHTPSKHRDGLMNPALADNIFGEWNHVYVPYCTSDLHSGTGEDIVMDDPLGVGPSFTMNFKGHHVYQAVVDVLEAGPVSDDGTESLPPIETADLVLYSGSSAGGGSVFLNLDRFAARFPTLDVRGLVDSHGAPQPEHFTHEDSGSGASFGVNYLEDSYINSYNPLWNSVVDDSCRTANPEGSATAWRCSNTGYVAINHVTTPFFLRYDLLDGNLGTPYLAPEPDGAGATHEAFSTAVVAWLEDVARAPALGAEGAEMTVGPGIFGPRCRHHTALGSDTFFMIDFIENGDDRANFHNALLSWLTGEREVWIDPAGEGRYTGCPTED